MVNKIDVHVLKIPSTDNALWEQCQQSLRGEPINLHVVDGVIGHIGRARYNGYSKGESPYISCVDPDDIVIPGAFEACLEALENRPEACGVFTDELIIDQFGKVIKPGIWSETNWNPLLQLEPKYLHHIFVMRRSFVEKLHLELLKWPVLADYVLKCLITKYGPWVHVNRYGYKWRMMKGSYHTKMSLTAVTAARWRVIPTLQDAAKKYDAIIRIQE